MREHRPFEARVLLICCIALSVAPLRAQTPPKLATFLRNDIRLDTAQLAAVERAQPVVKILDPQSGRDVAVFGIIRIDVPRESYVARLRDFPTSLAAPTRPRFGIFHEPASAADVAAVTVADQDVAELKDCRPGARSEERRVGKEWRSQGWRGAASERT